MIPLIICVHFNSMTGQIGEKEDTRVVTCTYLSVGRQNNSTPSCKLTMITESMHKHESRFDDSCGLLVVRKESGLMMR